MESRNWQPLIVLVCLSILAVVAGGWHYNKEYFTPNETKIQGLKQELEKVKTARQAWDEALARGINGDAVYETRFNYFTKSETPLSLIQPTLLKELTPFFEKHQMDFLGLTQAELEKKDLLTRVPFTLTGGARFDDIILLVRWLEEEKYGVVTGVNIYRFVGRENEQGPEKSAPQARDKAVALPFDFLDMERPDDWLAFSLQWHWVEGVPKNFISAVNPPELAHLEVIRDPFSSYAEEMTVIPTKKNQGEQEVVFQAAPESLHLNGIMAIKEGFKALLNNTYLEAGMNYEEYHVVEIKADEVILGKDRFRYRIRMARKQY